MLPAASDGVSTQGWGDLQTLVGVAWKPARGCQVVKTGCRRVKSGSGDGHPLFRGLLVWVVLNPSPPVRTDTHRCARPREARGVEGGEAGAECPRQNPPSGNPPRVSVSMSAGWMARLGHHTHPRRFTNLVDQDGRTVGQIAVAKCDSRGLQGKIKRWVHPHQPSPTHDGELATVFIEKSLLTTIEKCGFLGCEKHTPGSGMNDGPSTM